MALQPILQPPTTTALQLRELDPARVGQLTQQVASPNITRLRTALNRTLANRGRFSESASGQQEGRQAFQDFGTGLASNIFSARRLALGQEGAERSTINQGLLASFAAEQADKRAKERMDQLMLALRLGRQGSSFIDPEGRLAPRSEKNLGFGRGKFNLFDLGSLQASLQPRPTGVSGGSSGFDANTIAQQYI